MYSRGSNHRLAGSAFRSQVSVLMLTMFASMASIYVAGRLWLDSENRVYLIKELDRRTGQAKSAISVDDTLKIIACREQQKKLTALEMELAAAQQEGTDLKRLEAQKGIVIRFVIGRSANRGDSSDKDIDSENMQTNDFIILNNHVEAPEEHPKKTKLFFIHAAENWNAEFYAKVNDDVYVNIDTLGATLATHLDKPRVYIGCMKSGEVFSESTHKWYEPDWWKFGDGKSYFRHASGEIYVISQALAQFISINRSILLSYAHDDVTTGSWFIGLDVKYIDDTKFCCSSWASGIFLTTHFNFKKEEKRTGKPT
ncbi:hydroxyproline O-galactosyltransferase HPGT1 isoform X3 [Vitis vinifera]|uniref:hydroxyproline O-galactosyltransferase HPGT1 isoform X3 n=1 Tax=Vitis vinifera TaxID=29760 RepID=UPI002882DDDA|nr:hydroxyproline O-galactosyltransferase HPGT1 isoform X3 [Vitis vinifera]